jgi:hypothetical protein
MSSIKDSHITGSSVEAPSMVLSEVHANDSVVPIIATGSDASHQKLEGFMSNL